MRRARYLLGCVIAVAFATPALAANYAVSILDNTIFSGVPLRDDETLPIATGNGTCSYTVGVYAGPGVLLVRGRLESVWESTFSGGNIASTYATAQATDFVITGPAGPASVFGTLHLRVKATCATGGGFPGNGSHTADLIFNVNAGGNFVTGAYSDNNYSSGGSGVLSALVDTPAFDVPFTVSGNSPVGSSFSIYLFLKSTDATYGSVSFNNGTAESDAGGAPDDQTGRGLRLDSSGGAVMTLPDGYTINSES